MSKYTPMVLAAARELCKHQSAGCNVDPDDNWKIYGDDFLADAQAAIEASGAPELLGALKDALSALSGGLWDYGPGQDEHMKCQEIVERLELIIAKATGETK